MLIYRRDILPSVVAKVTLFIILHISLSPRVRALSIVSISQHKNHVLYYCKTVFIFVHVKTILF